MLMPTCPCCGEPCPECRHFTTSACDGIVDTGQVSVTVNGNALPYTVGVPASVVTSCCDPGSTVSATFQLFNTPPVNTLASSVNGCIQCFAYGAIAITICGWTFVLVFSRIAGACDDTGGAFSLGSPNHSAQWMPSTNVSEDCLIAVREWLNTFTIAGTITFDPCECPP